MAIKISSVFKRIEAMEHKLDIQPELARVFKQCYLNTLETTTEVMEDGSTFIFTGDIPAMWLRDSSAQIRPYLSLAGDDPELQRLVRGLIRRQVSYILADPYANAFNKEANGHGHQSDRTVMNPLVWERKFELDSLCYPIQLCQDYWEMTADSSVFDETLRRKLYCVLEVMRIEQHHDEQSSYTFERVDGPSSDSLPLSGRGTRTNDTGMVWSGFRPSDDACQFGYLIPANMFAVVVLGHVVGFAGSIYHDSVLAEKAKTLREEIEFGIQTYGIVDHPRHGRMYVYETDGYGNYNLMDDANVPSLLSIPYLGYRPVDDPIYQNTRSFILSQDNPYYFSGKYAKGVGSPHTPPGYIWPIGLIMQGLTSVGEEERDEIMGTLLATTAGTGYMHESFDPDRPEAFTREWFA